MNFQENPSWQSTHYARSPGRATRVALQAGFSNRYACWLKIPWEAMVNQHCAPAKESNRFLM
jgi:hypothetical protein